MSMRDEDIQDMISKSFEKYFENAVGREHHKKVGKEEESEKEEKQVKKRKK